MLGIIRPITYSYLLWFRQYETGTSQVLSNRRRDMRRSDRVSSIKPTNKPRRISGKPQSCLSTWREWIRGDGQTASFIWWVSQSLFPWLLRKKSGICNQTSVYHYYNKSIKTDKWHVITPLWCKTIPDTTKFPNYTKWPSHYGNIHSGGVALLGTDIRCGCRQDCGNTNQQVWFGWKP